MKHDSCATHFASAERASPEAIQGQHERLATDPRIGTLLDGFPEPAMILNHERQIVLANDKLSSLLARPPESLLGLRPGEAFQCIHAAEEAAGCGTTRFCRYCGAANAIVGSQRTAMPNVQDCRLQTTAPSPRDTFDLRVWVTPLVIGGEALTIFAVRDVSDEKRRQALERLFFHDVLNTVSALSGVLQIWPRLDGPAANEAAQQANELTDELIEEIRAQRDLAAAERRDLTVAPAVVDAEQLLHRMCASYARHSAADGKTLALGEARAGATFHSDPRLLMRVLGNLIKNALEASRPGQMVTVSFEDEPTPTFHVHNPTMMSEAVQAQMFQRSFSTKGLGRGLGAYGVRLLTEEYLGGTVTFHSTLEEGTTFTVRLPQVLDITRIARPLER